MNELLELFKTDIPAIIVGVFLIMAGINKGVEIVGKFSHTVGKPFKWAKKKDEKLEALKAQHEKDTTDLQDAIKSFMTDIKGQISELKSQMETYSTNRVNDRKQSFDIQKQLVKAQDNISDSLNKLIERVDNNEKKQNKRVQSDIKGQIAQLYRQYNATKCITDDEREALEDLIDTYEEYGGKNSFVHTKVQVEMYTWRVIKTDETKPTKKEAKE